MDDTRGKPATAPAIHRRGFQTGSRSVTSLRGEKCFALARYLDQRIELLQSPRFQQMNWLSEMLELLPLFRKWDERSSKTILLDDLRQFPHLQRHAPMFRRLAQAVNDGTVELLESDAFRRSTRRRDVGTALFPWASPGSAKPASKPE